MLYYTRKEGVLGKTPRLYPTHNRVGFTRITIMAEAPNAPTRSLRASANPQARMQELLRRDAPTPPHEEILLAENSSADAQMSSRAAAQMSSSADNGLAECQVDNEVGEALQQTARPPRQKRSAGSAKAKAAQSGAKIENDPERASSPAAQTTGSPAAQTTGSPAAQTTSSAVGSATGSAVAQTTGSAADSNLVHDAMFAMLALPYPSDMENGQMTVTTVKMPKPLWERLEYARIVTKQDKQDIIAAALRLYFQQIVEGNAK